MAKKGCPGPRQFVPRHDITGQRFGRLVAVQAKRIRTGTNSTGAGWLCECDCGARTVVAYRRLAMGSTRSCGCLRRDVVAATNRRNATHGRSSGLEYRSWINMIRRCYSRSRDSYGHYGAQGVTVADEWRSSFAAFLAHVGPRPGPEYSIDRINPFGNYVPGNVRWATQSMQNTNTRRAWARAFTFPPVP